MRRLGLWFDFVLVGLVIALLTCGDEVAVVEPEAFRLDESKEATRPDASAPGIELDLSCPNGC